MEMSIHSADGIPHKVVRSGTRDAPYVPTPSNCCAADMIDLHLCLNVAHHLGDRARRCELRLGTTWDYVFRC